MAYNGGTEWTSKVAEQKIFDTLPWPIKVAIMDMPIRLGMSTVRSVMARYHGRYDDQEIANMLTQMVYDYMHDPSPDGTATQWTYEIRGARSVLHQGKHDGKDHPQASRDYPWKNYQLKRRDRTKVSNIPG